MVSPAQRAARAARIAANRAESGRQEPVKKAAKKPFGERSQESQAEQSLYKCQRWVGKTGTRQRVLKRDFYICYLCGQGGAHEADHVISRTEDPTIDFFDESNICASHGITCRSPIGNLACNQIKGGYSTQRARRIIAERLGSAARLPEDEPEVPFVEGRPWLCR
jgi:hypothetical protein